MHRLARPALLPVLLLLSAACAGGAAPGTGPTASGGDTARAALRPVPVAAGFQEAVRRGTRTTTGQPGPRYWQQRVRYDIRAELNPRTAELKGSERIVYHHRGPEPLNAVVLNLYQNLFSGPPLSTGGIKLDRVVAQGQALQARSAAEVGGGTAGYAVTGTLGRIALPRPMATGDSAVFEIDWHFRVPGPGAPRTGYEDVLGGRVLQVAQWYPQIAVYDDVTGFDTTPYAGGGEFYLDYGDFDVALTLPDGWLPAGTGTLRNPQEVLSEETRRKLAVALASDTVVRVVSDASENGGTATRRDGRLTWRWTARDVRDFAFSVSNRYTWDAVRGRIPNGRGGVRNVAVHSLFRPQARNWNRSAYMAKHSIEFMSRAIVPYLYDQITVTEGPIYGMEYPMIVFVGRPQAAEELYEVITHEIGHEWYPMMVGQDEAAYGWMDEGITTFHEAMAVEDFLPNTDPWLGDRTQYLAVAGRKVEAPMMRHIDQTGEAASGVSAYWKPGAVLRGLRAVLGDSVFHRAMRTYTNEWMLKHPTPWDFFNTFERVAGRDLDWYWNPWFFRTTTLDQAIASVEPAPGGVRVTVRDLGGNPVPSYVVATTSTGQTVRATIPIESWLAGTRTASVVVPATGAVVRVELDPEMFFPDVNRRNNSWRAGAAAGSAP